MLRSLIVVAVLASTSAVQAQTPDTAGARGAPSLRASINANRNASDLRVVVQRFEMDRGALMRRYDIPLSPVVHGRTREFYTGWQRALSELGANGINTAGRADLDRLLARIAQEQDRLTAEEREFREMLPLMPFARTIQELQERRRERQDIDPMKAAQTLNDAVKEIRRMTEVVRGGQPVAGVTPAIAGRAAQFLVGASDPAQRPTEPGFGAPTASPTLRSTAASWHSFHSGYDPLFTWWTRKPYEEFNEALEAYARAIRDRWQIRT